MDCLLKLTDSCLVLFNPSFFDYTFSRRRKQKLLENHLNYFHMQGRGLPADFAKGLALYLNSTIVDQYFRLFSGHTQVNATDLRKMPYPTYEQLFRLGAYVKGAMPDQETIDAILEKECINRD